MAEMSTDHTLALRRERHLLLVSTFGAAVFASVAIAWGLVARSQIILFDGVWAIIGVVLAALSLRASALVEKGPTPHYPFGREALAPLIVGVQGVVLLGTFGYAAIDAVLIMISGGGDTALGSALVYGLVSTAATIVIWWFLKTRGRDSELVQAEAAQWAAGLWFSVAMIIGFGFAIAIKPTSLAWMGAYVDPMLVIIVAVLFAPTPLRMLRTMYRELLEAAPPPDVAEPIHKAIEAISQDYGLPAPEQRIGKLGRKVYIELDYLVEPDRWTVDDADRIRRDLMARLHKPGQLLWLNVELHTDPDWDR